MATVNSFTTDYQVYAQYSPPGAKIPWASGSTKYTDWSNSDTKPDYSRRHKPDGWLEPLPYSRKIETTTNVHGYWERTDSSNRAVKIGNLSGQYPLYWPDSNVPPAFPDSLVQRAEVQALLALKDQKVNLALAYQERELTAELLGHTAARLANAFNAVKRRDWRRAARNLGVDPKTYRNLVRTDKLDFIQKWLEMQYAWKPLLSDVYGSAEILRQRDDPKHWAVSVKGRAKEDVFRHGSTSPGTDYGFLWRMTGKHSCLVRLDYFPGPGFMHALSQSGISNPLLLNWERLPYSFVVDWALPIGDWLSSLDAAAGYDFRSGSCSRWSELEVIVDTPSPSPQVTAVKISGNRKLKRLDRTVYGGSPLPLPPSVKNPASLIHMANGLSLLAQAFGRGGQSRSLRL